MFTLIIAEKPSVAQSIAAVVGSRKREDGYLSGPLFIVSWYIGHLVALAPPQAYDAAYQKWRLEDLPIVPAEWKYEVNPATKKQLDILQQLMHRLDVDSIICATDAGREGDSLDPEDDRPRAVVAAGDHHSVIVGPALHDGAALQRGIYIPADGIPGLAAELPVHQMVEIVLLRCAFQQEGVARFEKRTRTGPGVCQILFLKLGKTLCFQNRDPAFMLYALFSLSKPDS